MRALGFGLGKAAGRNMLAGHPQREERQLNHRQPQTIRQLLQAGGDGDPAVLGMVRAPLSFRQLRREMHGLGQALNGLGLGRNDRVAMALPNGPEMAVSLLAVAAYASAAPLNPAGRRAEFDFQLSDLGAKALLIDSKGSPEAVAAARGLGIAVLELSAKPGQPAACFALNAAQSVAPAPRSGDGPAGPQDIALALHTSGTTARPKIVPLTQANLCASAANIAGTLGLGRADCCLNPMPLFHVHGLMAAVLASLGAGGSVFALPGFDALRFFSQLRQAAPSWYTAVPSMHQAILARAPRNRAIIAQTPLRFIRSSSAPLPPQVLADLEETFGVPVIEAYAMTEAAHQMTSNPLPPGRRKPGSVGRAAGPEVAIMDEQAPKLLGPGRVGEVVVRGANVTPGYEANPQANAEAFADGWFRTGDLGLMDEEGYLRIKGRLKEIINRGGEKISPREVDEALLDHPAIRQAAAFALPHPKLGEEVAAAVVLREGAQASESEIRRFAAMRLAAFKTPRLVLILDALPKGATGKLQRIGLAKQLGLA